MKKIKAYENKEVFYYSPKERKNILKDGTPKQKGQLYENLTLLLHYWDSDKKFFKSIETEKDQLRADEETAEKELTKILREKGFKVHLRGDEDKEKEHYIHFTFGICMHQIPKFNEWNESVFKYLFKEDDSLNTYEEFLNAFYKDKGINAELDEETQESFNSLDDDLKEAVKELLKYENEELKDITEVREENDGVYLDFGYKSYLIMTEAEAQERAEDYIKESLWAFNTDFIQSHCNGDISDKVIKAIQEQYEDGNEAILSLIEDINEFIEDAISADGRGHFLSSYDGQETELKNGFVYIRDN